LVSPYAYPTGTAYPLSFILFNCLSGCLGLGFFIVWLFCLYDCIRNEEDKVLWLLILIFLSLPGTLIYLLARVLPRSQVKMPKAFGRWTRSREIREAEASARHIGNPEQYTRLGDLYRETSQLDKAAEAYCRALERDPEHLRALWGLAQTNIGLDRQQTARENLEKILEIDPKFGYGEPPLTLLRLLHQSGNQEAFEKHLENHLSRWSHPEARFYKAEQLHREGKVDPARKELESLVADIEGSPKFSYQKNKKWLRKAKKKINEL
jgi:hypothetical protein